MNQSVGIEELNKRVVEHLQQIYPDYEDKGVLASRLVHAIGADNRCSIPPSHQNNWDQGDVVLITYGDTIVTEAEKPLRTLHRFAHAHLKGVVNAIHILPFTPYSSDDGFSVIDYLQVNDALGDWDDIRAIASDFKLMADLVINHASSRSRWFENYKKGIEPGAGYFIEAEPDTDTSLVVRPRNLPLLNPVQTLEGEKHVWCTFSPDQVDLNFRNPAVLEEFVRIIALYMDWGVKLFRMDAVAFLWKEPGTRCIHLKQTHEIIKLLRSLMEFRDPKVVIITETNVPNRENLTYFGNANEAHVIYNFSLPPLLVYTLATGNCRHLKTWMMSMPPAQNGTAYLNFIASHDGLGLRPAEDLLSDEEMYTFVVTMQEFGGMVTHRRGPDGTDKPYEVNISLIDALKGCTDNGVDDWQVQRFLCAHAIMLALEGIPAIYIHSFLGTENDFKKVENTGRNRSINRHVWDATALESELSMDNSKHKQVFDEIRRLIRIRRKQPAFHPNVTQFTLHLGTSIFAFWRQSMKRDQSIFAVNNISSQPQQLSLAELNMIGTDSWWDLISGDEIADYLATITLAPYQSLWLTNCRY